LTQARNRNRKRVFPAYAGVFRLFIEITTFLWGVPRIRGGVPQRRALHGYAGQCSPHTRGCSHMPLYVRKFQMVFPAYAGVFLLPNNQR